MLKTQLLILSSITLAACGDGPDKALWIGTWDYPAIAPTIMCDGVNIDNLDDVDIVGFDGTLTVTEGDSSSLSAHFESGGYDCSYDYSLPALAGNKATLVNVGEDCVLGDGSLTMTMVFSEGSLLTEDDGATLRQTFSGDIDFFGSDCSISFDGALSRGAEVADTGEPNDTGAE